ncbi:LOW QUALITY PROTEIN: hypothetical protein OSB04_027962 [Centaurea solstitialis]|uniref:Uncharacterized protein n=1 Tax=Centaurea solstitialis TaxID=347529 RepID=A0AA38ST39_9ASTR|nr:LOW QUALITY PROTEIN: hypothetical protein OSB04_027962 [Centaurea solstitialis]
MLDQRELNVTNSDHRSNNCLNRWTVGLANDEEREEKDDYEGAKFVEDLEEKGEPHTQWRQKFGVPKVVRSLRSSNSTHNFPYYLRWVKIGPEDQVIQPCQVTISIDKHYKDVFSATRSTLAI